MPINKCISTTDYKQNRSQKKNVRKFYTLRPKKLTPVQGFEQLQLLAHFGHGAFEILEFFSFSSRRCLVASNVIKGREKASVDQNRSSRRYPKMVIFFAKI